VDFISCMITGGGGIYVKEAYLPVVISHILFYHVVDSSYTTKHDPILQKLQSLFGARRYMLFQHKHKTYGLNLSRNFHSVA
jgi:hypothetical protein